MRIALVAPPLERVPPRLYGGTERVVHALAEELVRRGHDVTLFASGDSLTSAHLVRVVECALWHDHRYREHAPLWSVALGRAFARAGEFDLVHSHVDHAGFPLARLCATPVVTTLHGRLDLPELTPVFDEFREQWVVAISESQRRVRPEARWAGTVHNGIALDELAPCYEPGRYLAFLGRISPDKGVDRAIEVARRAGMPIRIAARMPLPTAGSADAQRDWRYYEEVVAPLFREPFVEYVGEVGGAEKAEFLRGAAALLFPIDWPEPFGLVMAEAMACGTPVIAPPLGSVPEVVADGESGFVRDGVEAMARACRELDRIDRRACRAHVQRRFSARAMADGYEAVYRRVLNAADRSATPAATNRTDGVLAWPPPRPHDRTVVAA
jgi:glycosyltransferase involved in cell wall biosynthesis